MPKYCGLKVLHAAAQNLTQQQARQPSPKNACSLLPPPPPHTLSYGPTLRSEPEALMVRRVAEALRPHVWLNVHSGMAALFMPYDHQNRIPGVM